MYIASRNNLTYDISNICFNVIRRELVVQLLGRGKQLVPSQQVRKKTSSQYTFPTVIVWVCIWLAAVCVSVPVK